MTYTSFTTMPSDPLFATMKFHHGTVHAMSCHTPAKFARRRARRMAPADRFNSENNQKLHVADLGDRVQLSIDYPGVKASNLNVQVEDRVLTISGKRSIMSQFGVRKVEYRRRFQLDHSIDADHVSANLSEGVLVVTAPKFEKVGPINVDISTNPSESVEMEEDANEDEDNDVVVVDAPDDNDTDEVVEEDCKTPAIAEETPDGEKKPGAK